jgi:CUB domain
MGSKLNCQSDYVEFLEEDEDRQMVSMKKYCGDDEPAVYVSPRSKLFVHFVQTLNFDGTGWLINFLGIKEGKNDEQKFAAK